MEQLSFDGMPEKPPVALPKRALYRGKVHRVLYYEGDNTFRLLDAQDYQVSVKRPNLTFLP